jgi:hypothetical protein
MVLAVGPVLSAQGELGQPAFSPTVEPAGDVIKNDNVDTTILGASRRSLIRRDGMKFCIPGSREPVRTESVSKNDDFDQVRSPSGGELPIRIEFWAVNGNISVPCYSL